MRKSAMVAMVAILLGMGACNGDTGENGGKTTGPDDPPLTITIGNLTDLTGPSAGGMDVVNMAVKDVVRYYNEEGLIPGVNLEVKEYDGQFDPSRDIPAYEWLRQRGADVIWTGVTSAPVTLRTRLEEDEICLFAPTVDLAQLSPPGHLFCVAIVPQLDAYTFLSWIAENDWDYREKGPAKIGGAGWTDAYSPLVFAAVEEYCQAHPDQFEWVGGYLTNYSATWNAEVEQLKDCDYVFPPNVMVTFVKQYREVGGKAKLLLEEPHLAFLGLVNDADVWDEMDGTFALRSSRWWNETGRLIDWTKELLHRYHPDMADRIIEKGVGYLGVSNAYQMLEAIRLAVAEVGVENYTPQAVYDAAQNLSLWVDDVELYSFSETKRASNNYYAVYEFRAGQKDIFRVDEKWFPTRWEP